MSLIRISQVLAFGLLLLMVQTPNAEAEESYSTFPIEPEFLDHSSIWGHATGLGISDDGKYGALVYTYGWVRYFDADTGWLWHHNTSAFWPQLAMSSDGQSVVVAGTGPANSSSLYFFTKDGLEWSDDFNSEDEGGFSHVDISADGEYIVAGNTDSNLYLFNTDGEVIRHFNITVEYGQHYVDYSEMHWFHSVSISSNGDYITAAYAGHLYLFHKESDEPIWKWTAPGGVFEGLSLVPSHTSQVDISADGDKIIAAVKYYPDSEFVCDDGRIIEASDVGNGYDDCEDGSDEDSENIENFNYGYGQFWAPTVGYIYMFGNEDNIPIWSYKQEPNLYDEDGNRESYPKDSSFGAAVISADGQYSAALYGDYGSGKHMHIFDNSGGTILSSFTATPNGNMSSSQWDDYRLDISATGKYILVASPYSGEVLLYDRDDTAAFTHHTGVLWNFHNSTYGLENGCNCHNVAMSSDGTHIMFGAGYTGGIDYYGNIYASDTTVFLFNNPRGANIAGEGSTSDTTDTTTSDDETTTGYSVPGPSLVMATFAVLAVASLRRRT